MQVGRRPWRERLEFPRIGVATGALAVALAIGLMGSAGADARGLKTGFIDDHLFTSPDPSVRATWLDRAVSGGAGIVRINVNWNAIVASKPASPTNPVDPSYDFSPLDSAVESARARGLRVMLTVLRAPLWAEGKDRPGAVRA